LKSDYAVAIVACLPIFVRCGRRLWGCLHVALQTHRGTGRRRDTRSRWQSRAWL